MINKPSRTCPVRPCGRPEAPKSAQRAKTPLNPPECHGRDRGHGVNMSSSPKHHAHAAMRHPDVLDPTNAAQAVFFARVADFVCAQAAVADLRDAARDDPRRTALWAPHWHTLRRASEHDAALFMCFLLACATLHVDVPRAAAAIAQSTDPAASMLLFLSERGLLRPTAFEAAPFSRIAETA